MIIALGVVAWLVVGVAVARAWAAMQDEGFEREYESGGARAGFNVVFWPLPAVGIVFTVIGLLVSWKGRAAD